MSKKIKKGKLKLSVAFFLAIKNLFFKKSMLFFIIMVVGLGYLSMTISGGIILGLNQVLEDSIIDMDTGHVVLEPIEDNNEVLLKDIDTIKQKLLSIPQVIGMSSILKKPITLIDDEGNELSGQLLIVDREEMLDATILESIIFEGEYFSKNGMPEIIIGKELVDEHQSVKGGPSINVGTGDKITLKSEGSNYEVKILAFFDAGFMMSNQKIYMSKSTAKNLFNYTDEDLNVASKIMVKLDGRGSEKEIVHKIRNLNINADVYIWNDRMGALKDFIGSLLIISTFTQVIGLAISFAIVFIMIFINVLQKKSQIGIMKAIGVNSKTILVSYIIQSMFYGLIGGFFGFLITRSFVEFFTKNPIKMPMGDVIPVISFETYLSTIGILFVSSVIAGYFASKGVVKEKILDAIFKG